MNAIPTSQELRNAFTRIAPWIHKTPVLTSTAINIRVNAEVFFKCENFQKVGAFKFRGASNAVLSMSDEDLRRGVATHSSGNHAQALALAAKMKGIPAYIVMPENAPAIKQAAVRGYGAEVILCEPTLAARESTVEAVIARTGATFVHPYNDWRIIAGQSTAAQELIESHPDLDIIIAPVGGGGLMSGTALAVHYFAPNMHAYGAEPALADDAARSLAAGKLIPSKDPTTIGDGLLTSLGDKTFAVIQKHVQGIHTCTEAEMLEAMRLIWERMKIIVEPSCAVPLAILLRKNPLFTGKKIGLILSGGNVDLDVIFDALAQKVKAKSGE